MALNTQRQGSASARWLVALVLAALMLPACGDDDVGSGDTATETYSDSSVDDTGTDTVWPTDTGTEPDTTAGGTIAFAVVRDPFFTNDFQPVEGATVAFDAPGGARTEKVTGPDGIVTFDGIDWTLGTAAATAYAKGNGLASVVGLDPEVIAAIPALLPDQPDAIVLQLPEAFNFALVESVQVWGTVVGQQVSSHILNVNAVGMEQGSVSFTLGISEGEFGVMVSTEQEFVLQAVETVPPLSTGSGQGHDQPIYQVLERAFEPLTADLSDVTLDFATDSLALHSANITVTLPPRAESAVRTSQLECYVAADPTTSGEIGWTTHSDITADGAAFEATLAWIEPERATAPYIRCAAFHDGDFGWVSTIVTEGFPSNGAVIALPDNIEWISPSDPSTAQPLHAELSWQEFGVAFTNKGLIVLHDFFPVWEVMMPPAATSLTIPDPPSNVEFEFAPGTTTLSALVFAGNAGVPFYDWDSLRPWDGFVSTVPALLEP